MPDERDKSMRHAFLSDTTHCPCTPVSLSVCPLPFLLQLVQVMDLATAAHAKAALVLRAQLQGGAPSDGELSEDDEDAGAAATQSPTKATKRKKSKTPGSIAKAPRAPTPYIIFSKEQFARMKREDAAAGGAAAKRERGSHLKEVGEKWKAMSEEGKQVYVERAKEEEARMKREEGKAAADEILEADDDSSGSDSDSSDSDAAPAAKSAPIQPKKKKKDKSGR